jgi:3-phenylpropionate/trans-cinnamate dioxygenase ferredoxin reductase component
MIKTVALVGGGQAAAVAARTLRRRGFDGCVDIVGDERHAPYQRPPLTKEYLETGAEDDLFLLTPEWCERNDVHLTLGRSVVAVHAARATVELDDGAEIAADRVLIATGGSPRRLSDVHGERVHYLRTLDEARRLRPALAPGARIVVVGAGFLGAEVAAVARARGAEVTMLEAAQVPLERVVGPEIGAALAALHADHGVDLRTGQQVVRVEETSDAVVVTTRDGRVEGDAVVVAIGTVPNLALARRSGIEVGDGILVDEFCRTSVPGVFAAGDVANHFHPAYGRRVRVEHFDNASKQAVAAANNLLGRATVYDEPHWFWSDQYEHGLHYAGHPGNWDEIVVRGSTAERDFVAFYSSGGRVTAAFGIDRGAEITVARELIAARVAVPADVLRDEDTDLTELLELQEQS